MRDTGLSHVRAAVPLSFLTLSTLGVWHAVSWPRKVTAGHSRPLQQVCWARGQPDWDFSRQAWESAFLISASLQQPSGQGLRGGRLWALPGIGGREGRGPEVSGGQWPRDPSCAVCTKRATAPCMERVTRPLPEHGLTESHAVRLDHR